MNMQAVSLKPRSKVLVTAALTAALVAGCAADDPNRSAKTGVAIGAVLGAIAGNQSKSSKGKYVGAVVGAIAGGAAGHYMDKQRAELEAKLKAEAAAKELVITKLGEDALRIGIASDASFDVGNAQLKADALDTFAKIASVLKDYDKTVIHVVGHTDSTGSDSTNQALSINRAASVGAYLREQGVPSSRLREEGRSKREPVADNSTADGRKRNRRVDIVIKPVIEGNEDAAWTPPPYLGA